MELVKDNTEWSLTFAWIPLRTEAGNWVWLTYIPVKKEFVKYDA